MGLFVHAEELQRNYNGGVILGTSPARGDEYRCADPNRGGGRTGGVKHNIELLEHVMIL